MEDREQGLLDHARPGRARFRIAAFSRSLQFKATVLVVTVTLCVTAAVTAYLLQSGVQVMQRQRREQLLQATAMVARTLAEPLARHDSAALEDLSDDSANGAPLLYVLVTDVDGREIASSEHRASHVLDTIKHQQDGETPVLGRPEFRQSPDQRQSYLAVSYPILARSRGTDPPNVAGGGLLGYVHAGLAADRWHKSMSAKLDLVIGLGTVATAMAVVLGFVLVRRIVSPLEDLAHAMVQFSQGQLKVRSPVRRSDEIGKLADSFNLMADQHQKTHERLLSMNAELEERVAERTKQLEELAARDPLTGLFNRRHFNEVLERSFSQAQRYAHDLTCIMADVDDFKSVNDARGHHAGDKLLMLIARTITRQLRAPDVAARYGGDEFLVLLPQTDTEEAGNLARRITECFERDLAAELPDVRVTLSLGIASLRSIHATEAESLLRAADSAMYDAKEAGKNRIVSATPEAGSVPR